MTTFEDDFPSLTKEIVDGLCPECDNETYCRTKISKYCLDRKKVNDVIDKVIPDDWYKNIDYYSGFTKESVIDAIKQLKLELKEELGL